MLHSTKQTILADNGQQVFANCDIEMILGDAYQRSSNNELFYSDQEICNRYNITRSELSRMKDLLSYDSCFDNNGNYKFN
jgi:hypothetical protein